eukprot:3063811-Rhodomonas_salina.1
MPTQLLSWYTTIRSGTRGTRRRVHPEIQHEKPHFRFNWYKECGFWYLSLQCWNSYPGTQARGQTAPFSGPAQE